MKKIILIIISLFLFIPKVFAVTLSEALTQAYKNNTELNAERENIKVSGEDLNISKGEYLPTLTLSGSKSQEDTNKLTNQSGGDAAITDVDPLSTSITIEQTLIDFGRSAQNEKNIIGISLAKAKLLKKEQDILYKAIEAYTGVILANEKFEINKANVNLLERQVETDSIRLERGQVTLSDVAQSESSLAEAQARFIQAENEVLTSKLNYENIIGPLTNSKSLLKNSTLNFIIPSSLNSAIELSKKNNPDLTISKLEYEQSEKDTIIAKSDLSPTAKLSFERSYSEDLSSTYDEREKDILKATVSWPFYSGGKNRATYNKKQNLQTRKRLLLNNTTKINDTNVASAWSNFQSSKSLLNSVELQVKAAEIANEGITLEYESGGAGRSTLDVIQSNSMLLESRINLANSERNFILSRYKLLQSIGLLNLGYLGLNN